MSQKVIGIVDTGAGNLSSLQAAIKRINKPVKILSDNNIAGIDQLVLPGQGRFGTVMANLKQKQWLPTLDAWHRDQRPVFGICVGFQIFFETSEEDPEAKGLAWFEGQIKRLASPKQPMVGWSAVQPLNEAELSSGEAYFVNSFVLNQSTISIATSEYGQKFVSAIRHQHVSGVQFHPEKSSAYGMEVLAQCLAY